MRNEFKVREDQTRTSSPTLPNESTHHNPTLSPNQMHMQGVRATESMKTTEWTDEKHSMYLKSIETSFVNQLYDSKHIIANSLPRNKGTTHDPAITSGQFKVLRGGSWRKINFERDNNPQQMGRNNNQCQYDLTSNPWVQHYRCSSKQRGDVAVAVPSLQESVTSTSRVVDSSQRKKGGVSCGPTRQLHQSHVSHQDMLSSDTEMSDQNFVDEEVEGKKETKRNKVKRHKSLIIDQKGNDQMVPSKSSCMEYVTKDYYPST